jgi:hypothetical protein
VSNGQKKSSVITQCREQGLERCARCPHPQVVKIFENLPHVYCAVNAVHKDVLPWVSRGEANQCPGHERRALYLGAHLHYAKTPPDS